MTFLTPIPAIIAACISVPLLLLYYFLKLRRRPIKVSSTLLWERATKDLQVNTPFRLLRVSLLLILQLLILAAFLLALARPAIDDPLGAASRVVILIDTSASMSARDGVTPDDGASLSRAGATTRLDQARREATRLIDKLTGVGWLGGLFGSAETASRVCIVDFAHRAAVRTPFTSDRATLTEAIEGVSPTDQLGNISDALRLVAGLAAPEPGEEQQATQSTTVFILSDASFPEHLLPSAGTPDVRLIAVGLAPPPPATPLADGAPAPQMQSTSDVNLGITALSARRDLETPALVRVFARVQSNANGPISTTARLTLDGIEQQIKVVNVPGANDVRDKAAPDAKPGSAPEARLDPEAPVTFEFENTEGGLVVVTLGSSDLLASDDAAALVLRPAARAKALLVAPAGKPDEFITSALDGIDLPIVTTVEPEYYEQLALVGGARGSGGADVPSSNVQDWDIVIFDRYKPARVPPIPSISVGAGLPIAGLSLAPIRVSVDENGAPSPVPSARFATWRRTHAIMQSVSLDGVLIAPPMSLSLPTTPSLNTTVLAWGGNYDSGASSDLVGGPLIALIETVGAGSAAPKRLVLAFEIAQTTWGIDFSFPIFMKNAVEFLSTRSSGLAAKSYATNEPISLPAASGSKQLVVRGPRNMTIPVRASDARAESGSEPASKGPDVAIGALDRVGVYDVEGAAVEQASGGTGVTRLAVNLCDAWESRIGTRRELDVPGTSRRAIDAAGDARREIWRWFVAGALALLTLEWIFFAKRMRV